MLSVFLSDTMICNVSAKCAFMLCYVVQTVGAKEIATEAVIEAISVASA
jgi:hypothetical protein